MYIMFTIQCALCKRVKRPDYFSCKKNEFERIDGKALVDILESYLCTGSSEWVSVSNNFERILGRIHFISVEFLT